MSMSVVRRSSCGHPSAPSSGFGVLSPDLERSAFCSDSALLFLSDHTTATTIVQVFVWTTWLKASQLVSHKIIAAMVPYSPCMHLLANKTRHLAIVHQSYKKKLETTHPLEKHLALERENAAAKDSDRFKLTSDLQEYVIFLQFFNTFVCDG
jgi:hypothetical protein